ncbi:hypothetical protein [Amycolatopsis sp. cmx-11-51]|uniref:hypothetical protein n=1 Tax=unclassified Amycolatopsis TaxID=2618356 RepID=UPI0039E4CE40
MIRRRGFLAVAGDERPGLRVLIQEPDLTAEPAMEVVRGYAETDLRAAERAVITGFEPYRAREVFPTALLGHPAVEVFVARLDGEVAGACVTAV